MSRRRRDALIVAHLDLVEQIAAKLCTRMPPHFDRRELACAGRVGLVEASRSFDPAVGVPFGAFARRRVAGAMVDHLRALDMLPRTARQRARDAGETGGFMVQLHLDDPDHVRAHGLDVVAVEALDPALPDLFLRAHVQRALDRLPKRERYVIEQHFYRGRLLVDIGEDLNVGQARASQLKLQALTRLRRWLAS